MLLDKFLSEYDFTERHQIVVRADRGAVLRAVRELRPGDVPISGLLMAIRTLGARRRVPDRPILTGLQANGVALLGEIPDEEMVLGTIGQFWRFRPVHRDATNFVAFDEPGFAKAAINFRVTDRGDGTTLIMKVVGKDATSTFTQTADGIAINCKNFSIEAETVTTGGVASAAIDEPSPPSSAG